MRGLVATVLLAAGTTAWGQAHVHGLARLEIVLDGPVLVIALEAPLDGIVGFEHAPRTPAQKQLAQKALAALKDPERLFGLPAEASCRPEATAIEAPVLQGTEAKDGHGDLDARWTYRCAAPARLQALEQGLFEAFPRLLRLEVLVAGPRGQTKATLRRPVRAVTLQR